MRGFRYFHVCNHAIRSRKVDDVIETRIFMTPGKLIEVLVNNAAVIEIEEIRIIRHEKTLRINPAVYDDYTLDQTYDDADQDEVFYDESDDFIVDYAQFFDEGQAMSRPIPARFYETYLHNRIRWLVRPPQYFYVRMKVKYTNVRYDYYDDNTCPRCEGRGWYVDIFDNDAQFRRATSIDHILQDVLRMLLTKTGSSILDVTAGSDLIEETLGKNASNIEDLRADVQAIVSDIEDRYLSKQADIENIKDYAPEEILVELFLKDFRLNPSNVRQYILDIVVVTEGNGSGELFTFRF